MKKCVLISILVVFTSTYSSTTISLFNLSSFNCTKCELLVSYIKGGKTTPALSTSLEGKQVSIDSIFFIIGYIQRNFNPSFNKRRSEAGRNNNTFLRKNTNWLDFERSLTILQNQAKKENNTILKLKLTDAE